MVEGRCVRCEVPSCLQCDGEGRGDIRGRPADSWLAPYLRVALCAPPPPPAGDPKRCNACALYSGLAANGSCVSCPGGCADCTTAPADSPGAGDQVVCTACQQASGGVDAAAAASKDPCVPCKLEGCAVCTEDAARCQQCELGFFLEGNGTTCSACPGQSTADQPRGGCAACEDPADRRRCTGCHPGFRLDNATHTCQACPENCRACSKDAAVCEECSLSFRRVEGGACEPCSDRACKVRVPPAPPATSPQPAWCSPDMHPPGLLPAPQLCPADPDRCISCNADHFLFEDGRCGMYCSTSCLACDPFMRVNGTSEGWCYRCAYGLTTNSTTGKCQR